MGEGGLETSEVAKEIAEHAKHPTGSRITIAEASTARDESSTAHLTALDVRIGDALIFNAWLGASATGNQEATDIALRRFRPELKVAFDAWLATDPDHSPNAPAGPHAMPEYKQPELEAAKRADVKAEHLFHAGSEQGSDAHDDVRTTVYLAPVLFMIGISSHFPVPSARYGLIVVGVVILLFSVTQLLSFPRPV